MKKRELHHSGIFLMELMIAILFFALAGAVCMRLFAKSYQLNRQTEELHKAVNLVSSKAEELLHAEESAVDFIFDDFTEYYGKDFSLGTEEDAFYELSSITSVSGNILTYDISFLNISTGKNIYSLSVDKYLKDKEKDGGDRNE